MDLSRFERDDWIIAGLALFLAIDLLFLPWWSTSVGFGPFTVSVSGSGTDAPDGWLGVLAVLGALALIADLVLDRLGAANLPSIGGSRAITRFMFAAVAAVCVAFKFILHVSFTADHWDAGFWLAIVVVGAMVAVAVRSLRAESLTSSTQRPRHVS
jgi:hypothetical protein